MRQSSKAVEPRGKRDLPYPIETLRFWYVSPFGGRSDDLAQTEVGVNGEALARNTELEPLDSVEVGILGSNPRRPWFFDVAYEVVALDGRRREAVGLSVHGEVVLPRRPAPSLSEPSSLEPRVGEAVVLKGAAAARLVGETPLWLEALLRTSVRRPEFRGGQA